MSKAGSINPLMSSSVVSCQNGHYAQSSRAQHLKSRQWPEVSDFVARFGKLRESNNTRPYENRTRFMAV